jgi:glycosyltransferase involved in cell wall biosynthesis
LCAIPKAFGYKVVLHADGFDWRRKKWGWLARTFIHRSASLAAKLCDRLIFDCASARDYCAGKFRCRRQPVYIPNGATPEPSEQPDLIRQYGLEKDGYFLFLSRIEPENMCDLVVKAFERLKTDKKLLLAGGAPAAGRYLASLKKTADPRILFPGPIYDPLHVKELHYGCYALVHGNQAGGTSVGLLKGLSFGTCVLSLNTPDNAYVVRDAGLLYEPTVEDLHAKMQHVLDHPHQVLDYRRKAVERIGSEYLWDNIADTYEALFQQIVSAPEQDRRGLAHGPEPLPNVARGAEHQNART